MKRKANYLWLGGLALLLALVIVALLLVPPPAPTGDMNSETIAYGWTGGALTDDGTGNKVLSVSVGSAVSEKFTVYQGFSYTASADVVGEGAIDIVFYDKDGALLADTAGASSTGSTDETAPFGATQAVISLSATGTATFDNITIKDNTVVASGSIYTIPLVNGDFSAIGTTMGTPLFNSQKSIPGWGISGCAKASGKLTGSYFQVQPPVTDSPERQLFAQVGTVPQSATDSRLAAPTLSTLSRIPVAPGLTYTLGGLSKKLSGDATYFRFYLMVFDEFSTKLVSVYTNIDYPAGDELTQFSGSLNLDEDVYAEYPTAVCAQVRFVMQRATVNALFDDLVLQVSGYTAPVLTNGTLDDAYTPVEGSIPSDNLS